MAKQVTVTEQAWNEIWDRFPNHVQKLAEDRAAQGDVESLGKLVESGVLIKHFIERDYELAGAVLEILLNCVEHDRDEDEDADLIDRWFSAYGHARDEVLDGLLLRVKNHRFVETLFNLGARLRVFDYDHCTALGKAINNEDWTLAKSITEACNLRDLPPNVDREHTLFSYLSSSNYSLKNFDIFRQWLGDPCDASPVFMACAASAAAAAVAKNLQRNKMNVGGVLALAYADFHMSAAEIEALSLVSVLLHHDEFYVSSACIPVLRNLVAHGVEFRTGQHPVAHALKANNSELLTEFAKLKIPAPKKTADPENKYKALVASLAAKDAIEAVKQNLAINRIINSQGSPKPKLRAA